MKYENFQTKDCYGLLDKKGCIALYAISEIPIRFKYGYGLLKIKDFYAYIGKDLSFYGKNYIDAKPFSYNRAIVAVESLGYDGKWHTFYGVIDDYFKEIIPFKYDNIKEVSFGYYKAVKDGVAFYFDRSGRKVEKPLYFKDFKDDMIKLKGYLDKSDEICRYIGFDSSIGEFICLMITELMQGYTDRYERDAEFTADWISWFVYENDFGSKEYKASIKGRFFTYERKINSLTKLWKIIRI